MSKTARALLDKIKINPQVRKFFVEEELLLLGESLKIKQLQPIVIRSDGTLLAGERRVRAARLVGMTELWALVIDEALSDAQIEILQLTENLHRSDLSAIERFDAFQSILAKTPGAGQKELCEQLKLTPPAVSRIMALGRLVPAALDTLRNRQISDSIAYQIAQATPERQPALLAEALNGATRDQLAAKRQAMQAQAAQPNGQPRPAATKVNRVVFPCAEGKAHVQIKGEGFGLAEAKEALEEALRGVRAAITEKLDAKVAQQVWARKNANG